MEPIKYTYSKEEMVEAAKKHCKEVYGDPLASEDREDKWMERFGAILYFVLEKFPK